MDETIAVYIDGDNLSHINCKDIIDEIKTYGRIILARVYGDWSETNMKNWLISASSCGIVPIQCDRISGKNSSDIKLCVDIMKDLYTIDNITLFYIITTDSDYRHVVSEIKLKNKKINCIGNSYANISLMSICDQYTKLDIIINKYSSKKRKYKKIKKNNIQILIKEIEEIIGDNEEINISLIKDILSRKYNFDLREWGYNKMSKFLIDIFNDNNMNINIKSDKRGTYIYNREQVINQ